MRQGGTLKSFDDRISRGFLRPDDGGTILGFKSSVFAREGISPPIVGQRVSFETSGANADASATDVHQTLSASQSEHRELETIEHTFIFDWSHVVGPLTLTAIGAVIVATMAFSEQS